MTFGPLALLTHRQYSFCQTSRRHEREGVLSFQSLYPCVIKNAKTHLQTKISKDIAPPLKVKVKVLLLTLTIFLANNNLTTMERAILKSLVALLLFSVLENVISTVVGPTLIFYIQSVGGSNDDYGLTTSSACVGSALMTFYFGKWIDSNGNKYQAPLSASFILGIVGSIIYFAASLLPVGFWGINAILAGRFVSGMGGAGKALTRSWIATAVPLENQVKVLYPFFVLFSTLNSFYSVLLILYHIT